MEDCLDDSRVSIITCATWVPKGVAKSNPDKVEITKEELARIIKETQGCVNELEEIEEDAFDECDDKVSKKAEKENNPEVQKGNSRSMIKKMCLLQNDDEDKEDLSTRYGMGNYDENDDDKLDQLLQLGYLTMHSTNEEDPLITVKDEDDVDSEKEDHFILPTDNLIAVGHVEGDAAVLEVYVYNSEESSFYIHHDILLPAVPLCMEWLNYDPGDEQLKPGNLVAIGSMSPIVQVWDLDIIDSLEPAYVLGKKAKKKKKIQGYGHTDAVLSIAWNKQVDHVLASGSVDQTVILWDLQEGTVAQTLNDFTEKVQSIQWHHTESQTLLTGSCDSLVRMFDCRTENTFKRWKLDGEVECVVWDLKSETSYNCLASTENGTVFYIDTRQDKPLWTLKAHTSACTAVRMSPQCPGCLITVSSDKSVKIWDVANEKPEMVDENLPKLGLLHCLDACPDAPFVFCIGGDNKENNFSVWDIRESRHVRSRFCNRIGLPVDEEYEEPMEDEETVEAMRSIHLQDKSQEKQTYSTYHKGKGQKSFSGIQGVSDGQYTKHQGFASTTYDGPQQGAFGVNYEQQQDSTVGGHRQGYGGNQQRFGGPLLSGAYGGSQQEWYGGQRGYRGTHTGNEAGGSSVGAQSGLSSNSSKYGKKKGGHLDKKKKKRR